MGPQRRPVSHCARRGLVAQAHAALQQEAHVSLAAARERLDGARLSRERRAHQACQHWYTRYTHNICLVSFVFVVTNDTPHNTMQTRHI